MEMSWRAEKERQSSDNSTRTVPYFVFNTRQNQPVLIPISNKLFWWWHQRRALIRICIALCLVVLHNGIHYKNTCSSDDKILTMSNNPLQEKVRIRILLTKISHVHNWNLLQLQNWLHCNWRKDKKLYVLWSHAPKKWKARHLYGIIILKWGLTAFWNPYYIEKDIYLVYK